MPKKRSNPNNPLCSSMVQAVLEFKELGGSLDVSLAEFLKLSKEDKETQRLIREADKAVDRKGYPDSTLTFHKSERNVEVGRVLSGTDLKVLRVFESSVNQSNLLRISLREVQSAAGISLNSAKESISSLLRSGCIAVKTPGSRNVAAVYMLNPEISTVGNSKVTPKIFWELTGSLYEVKNNKAIVVEFSKPHEEWIKLTAARTYTVGPHANGKPGDPEYLKFNVLHFLDEKKATSSSGNDEAADADGSENN